MPLFPWGAIGCMSLGDKTTEVLQTGKVWKNESPPLEHSTQQKKLEE